MYQVVTDFMLRQRRTIDAEKLVVELGTTDRRPELRALRENEGVLLIYPGNLKAEGHIVIDVSQGQPYYYGVIDGEIVDDVAEA